MKQTELRFGTWGGKRKGAGRPKAGLRSNVPHRARPVHSFRHPVHVTLRLRRGIPSLREELCFRSVSAALVAARRHLGMRVVHYSVQANHVHLLVEANDKAGLCRAVRGLSIRIARQLNGLFRRRGRVFGDRYHARPLTGRRQVKNALVYVLNNFAKHREDIGALPCDPYSSARHFDGWREGHIVWPQACGPPATARPNTWLLKEGWKLYGRPTLRERPAAAEGPRSPTSSFFR